MMRGPGSGWCKMKSPADTVCVAGRIPESPSSSSARQRLRPSARVPPSPRTRALCCEGRAQPGCTASAGPLWGRGSDRPRLRPAPARGAAGVARGGRPSLPGSFAGEAGLAAPSSVEARGPGARPAVASPCTVAADIRAQSAPSRAAWPLGTAPERLGARRGGRGRGLGMGTRVRAREAHPLRPAAGSRLRLPGAPPPRAAAAAAAATSRARPDPGLSTRRPARRARGHGDRGPRGGRPCPRRGPSLRGPLEARDARPLALGCPRSRGTEAPGPLPPYAACRPCAARRGGGGRLPRPAVATQAAGSRFICVKRCLFDSL